MSRNVRATTSLDPPNRTYTTPRRRTTIMFSKSDNIERSRVPRRSTVARLIFYINIFFLSTVPVLDHDSIRIIFLTDIFQTFFR